MIGSNTARRTETRVVVTAGLRAARMETTYHFNNPSGQRLDTFCLPVPEDNTVITGVRVCDTSPGSCEDWCDAQLVSIADAKQAVRVAKATGTRAGYARKSKVRYDVVQFVLHDVLPASCTDFVVVVTLVMDVNLGETGTFTYVQNEVIKPKFNDSSCGYRAPDPAAVDRFIPLQASITVRVVGCSVQSLVSGTEFVAHYVTNRLPAACKNNGDGTWQCQFGGTGSSAAGVEMRYERHVTGVVPAAAFWVRVQLAAPLPSTASLVQVDDTSSVLVAPIPRALVSKQSPVVVYFVLDCSGSMSGEPAAAMRRMARVMIMALPVGTRVVLVPFGDRAKVLGSFVLTSGTDRDAAVAAVSKLEGDMGGTSLMSALRLVATHLGTELAEKRHCTVVLTDGAFCNDSRFNDGRLRVFGIALGRDASVASLQPFAEKVIAVPSGREEELVAAGCAMLLAAEQPVAARVETNMSLPASLKCVSSDFVLTALVARSVGEDIPAIVTVGGEKWLANIVVGHVADVRGTPDAQALRQFVVARHIRDNKSAAVALSLEHLINGPGTAFLFRPRDGTETTPGADEHPEDYYDSTSSDSDYEEAAFRGRRLAGAAPAPSRKLKGASSFTLRGSSWDDDSDDGDDGDLLCEPAFKGVVYRCVTDGRRAPEMAFDLFDKGEGRSSRSGFVDGVESVGSTVASRKTASESFGGGGAATGMAPVVFAPASAKFTSTPSTLLELLELLLFLRVDGMWNPATFLLDCSRCTGDVLDLALKLSGIAKAAGTAESFTAAVKACLTEDMDSRPLFWTASLLESVARIIVQQ